MSESEEDSEKTEEIKRPAMQDLRTSVKVESLSKFDPALEGSFRKYHIKLRSVLRAHGLGDAMDVDDETLDTLLKKVEDYTAEEKTIIRQSNPLYLTIVNTIVDTTDEGEDLLSLLYDNHDRINTGLTFDNGAGAYNEGLGEDLRWCDQSVHNRSN